MMKRRSTPKMVRWDSGLNKARLWGMCTPWTQRALGALRTLWAARTVCTEVIRIALPIPHIRMLGIRVEASGLPLLLIRLLGLIRLLWMLWLIRLLRLLPWLGLILLRVYQTSRANRTRRAICLWRIFVAMKRRRIRQQYVREHH